MSDVAAENRPSGRKRKNPRAALPSRHDVRLLCEIDALPVAAGVPLRDLRARHCRWVAAVEAPWVFCGEQVACGSYCAAHAGLVYVKYRKGMFDDG